MFQSDRAITCPSTVSKDLAKASLAPTFKDMTNTVEGAIAAIRQFGFGVDQLEAKLGAINADLSNSNFNVCSSMPYGSWSDGSGTLGNS